MCVRNKGRSDGFHLLAAVSYKVTIPFRTALNIAHLTNQLFVDCCMKKQSNFNSGYSF